MLRRLLPGSEQENPKPSGILGPSRGRYPPSPKLVLRRPPGAVPRGLGQAVIPRGAWGRTGRRNDPGAGPRPDRGPPNPGRPAGLVSSVFESGLLTTPIQGRHALR